jgi:lipopolysaccharide transport system ATP-binding protein
VGDYAFQKKCEQRMNEMMSGGTTLLYVSHSHESVKTLCSHALWLEKGREKMRGDAKTVCDSYIQALGG